MDKMNPVKGQEGAPLKALAGLIEDPSLLFEFSFYRYIPDSASDPRRLAWVKGGPSGMEDCFALLGQIEEGEELAMHSTVVREGASLHIPMLDLACSGLGEAERARLSKFIPEAVMAGLSFYQSGRSFHAYGSQLMSLSDIHAFWGAALLANPVDGPAVSDARWIGHRMISGRGALRISARQERSLLAPQPMGE